MPGTWEALPPPGKKPEREPGDQSPGLFAVAASAAGRSERNGALVPGGEGHEPPGTGGRESELLHSTEENGELNPQGPKGGKAAAGSMEPRGGKDDWEIQPR